MKFCCPSLFPLVVFASTVSTGFTEAADEWPQFRGPDGNGYAATSNLPVEWSESKNIAWKTAIPGRGHSSPVVSGESIWMTAAVVKPLSDDEKQAKLDDIPNSRSLDIAGNVSLRAVCVDRESGRLLHDVEVFSVADPPPIHSLNSYASPTPVLNGERLFVHFGALGTACLDAESGRILWKKNELKADHQNGPGGSPLYWNGLLIVQYDGIDVQFIAALDGKTGEVAWKTPRSGKLFPRADFQKAYATPIVIDEGGRPQLISPGADWLYSYDPKTGKELWRTSYGKLGFSTVPKPVYGDGKVFIATSFMQSRLLAIGYGDSEEKADDRVAWTNDRQIPSKPSLLLVKDRLYMVNDKGIASCLDASSGDSIWQERLGGQYSASPLFADGRIYLFDQEGRTTVIAPGEEYQELAKNKLDAGFMASPAVAGSALFLRTETHLYRIERVK